MGVDSPSRKWIGTKRGKQRLSTLQANKLAQKKDTRPGVPSREEMREYIKDQWCWWCDSGPWKCLSAHTSKAHGILGADIREFAYLFKRAVICSPEHSHAAGVRFDKLEKMGLLRRPCGKSGVTHVLGTAGRDAVVASSKKTVRSLAFRKGFAEYNERAKRPHPCPGCGKMMPSSKPVCCSKECTKKASRWRRGVGSNPALSKKRKHLYATGQLIPYNPMPPKPHNCPICGTLIKYSHPVTCSPECAKALTRLKNTKPHPCPVCGVIVPTSSPKTCSPACRKIIRQSTALISAATRVRNRKTKDQITIS